ncbi:hypothetical protein LIER_13942 [Lithospermum erythrorhizon]|uniref:Reverse transcriptase/retrotransposon-derived protein RNase H-like domain-containing protein n=1 Tax=Lithospermum erythrorhizon TaxID=34254 RepID=A0AAV3PX86_LITER
MQPPREYKDIQKLTGCLVALSQFISKSGEHNLPFFKNLRRASNTKFCWDDCYKAFEELKEYLSLPRLLSQHEAEETLQLYIAVSDGKVSSVLVREVKEGKIPIYYLSGRLTTWAIELSEFDISYVPRTSIKAPALADFIIECTAQPPQVISGLGDFERGLKNPEWVLFVDGARNEKGSGAGVLI